MDCSLLSYEGKKRRAYRRYLRKVGQRCKVVGAVVRLTLYDLRDVNLYRSSFIRGHFTCDDDKRIRF